MSVFYGTTLALNEFQDFFKYWVKNFLDIGPILLATMERGTTSTGLDIRHEDQSLAYHRYYRKTVQTPPLRKGQRG